MKIQPLSSTIILGLCLCVGLSSPTSGEGFRLPLCEDKAMKGWSFYCRPPPPEEKAEEPAQQPAAQTPTDEPKKPEEDPEAYPATTVMMAYRKELDEAKYLAVLEPTRENVENYMEMQKEMIGKAGYFTDQWQRIIFGTPHLSATSDYPLAAAGIGVYQDQMNAVRDQTFREIATQTGVFFIFEDDARCGICRVQGEILKQMEEQYGVSILAVSKDGGANSHYPNAVHDPAKLDGLGLGDYPAPSLALVQPGTGAIEVIGSGLLTADEIVERVFVITKIPVGERY